jgi:hypothetical protein
MDYGIIIIILSYYMLELQESLIIVDTLMDILKSIESFANYIGIILIN